MPSILIPNPTLHDTHRIHGSVNDSAKPREDKRQYMCQTSGTGQLKRDGTHAETRFNLSAKWTSPFKSAGASVQSTAGSQGVRISGNNAGYAMF